ncbi:Plasma membrane t-SNARE, secretory vesicle fusion [Lobosporangium transversale]|uniref:t-SNARE n=1 Tax=Lobosporangium transversale TaxID=64571 RepID=A0A1Y2G904_9FUNG|nr:t-SNARE [Lobosporangium transversale]KAF9919417.1 Plasma membrane t-SNARE, secretory vesicle fusion [Lobosporangium transversale]ORZ04555.1 t-SNARE [Lobosporangium transversale]|eukprot:XP_021876601.1 t-SNARE [Lobosporangium transversale]
MSRDRLNDFNNGSAAYGDKDNGNQTPVELAPLRGDTLNQFFQETEVIQTKIQQFQTGISEIDQLYSRKLSSSASVEVIKQLEERTQSTNSLSTEIYDRLRALTSSNMKVRTKEEYDQRKLRTSTLSKQFKEAVSRYQNVQYENGQKAKETMARQFRIANPQATEEDIKRLVDEEQGGAFTQQLLQQTRGQQATLALNNVQDRQRELKKLQESVVELAELYKQMETLIFDQDLTFQQIEGNVMRAEQDLEKGLGQVDLAYRDASAARKKKWMALGIIVLIIAIILVIGAIQGWFRPAN